MNKSECGRLGGLATLNKYGREFYVACGHRGGRPKAVALEDILRSQQSLEAENKEREERIPPDALASASLSKLRRLWRLKQNSRTAIGQNNKLAGVVW